MEREKIVLEISQFSLYPGPRYCSQGNYSGEQYYYDVLNATFAKAVLNNQVLEVILDGTAGYASSFLDEAFGNLVYDFTKDIVLKHLKVVSKDEPDWTDMILNSVTKFWEDRRLKNQSPKVTDSHQLKYILDSNGIVVKQTE